MHFFCRGVMAGPEIHLRCQIAIVIRRFGQHIAFQQITAHENLTFAGLGQDDEFMRQVAANRPRISAHRNGLQAHARKGPQIGQEHLPIGMLRGFLGQIKGIGVLHQEFAPAHHAETWAHFIAEFPLDVIKVARQIAIGFGELLEDIGDHFLIGRAEQHFAFMPVTNAEHFLSVIIIAPAFAPQLRGLDGRHQDFLRPGAVLFFAHNLFNAAQHAQPRRQPGIDARRGLANQPRTQHEAVRGDLRLGRGFLECRQKGASEAQGSIPLILSR